MMKDKYLAENLKFLHLEKNVSAKEISEMFSVSPPLVSRWFKKYDIKINRNGQPHYSRIDVPSREDLYYLYVEKQLTYKEMAFILNVSVPMIPKWLSIRGIDSRSRTYQLSDIQLNKLNCREWMVSAISKYREIEISEQLGVGCSCVGSWRKMHHIDHISRPPRFPVTSNIEDSVNDFIRTLTPSTIRNDRSIISPLELDIVILEKKVAIELDGVYWHSEVSGNKNRKYHLNKTEKCEAKGYQLFHIFDSEWNEKKDIWKSVISNALGICNKKIWARKCKIVNVDSMMAKDFLEKNHLQGSCQSSVRCGLEIDGNLVSLMTFGKSRFSKKYDWEMIRFCSSLDVVVVGGASRLLSHFRRHHPGSILSYANRRWSTGHLYETLGFDYSHDTTPNYFYVKSGLVVGSRNKYQKHKLGDILPEFHEELSEWQNMKNNGFDRIWDCGSQVWALK